MHLFWKKILPASKNQVNVKFEEIKNEFVKLEKKDYFNQIISNQNQQQENINALICLCQDLKQQCEKQEIEIDNLKRMLDFDSINSNILNTGQRIEQRIEQSKTEMFNKVEVVRREAIQTKRASKEAVWGEIFKDATMESAWLKNKVFYPGRWAVGYQYLYVLYRILNSVQPKNILELGLGQSTTMITQYADSISGVIHRVIEHDVEWIDYYQKEFAISERTEVVNLEISKVLFQSKYELYRYLNFKDRLEDMKYDFISIDAPFGGAENEYSRIDVLDIIPMCLESSFIIMIDDVNRKGEQNTIQLIEKKLEDNNIIFTSGKYVGDKDTYVIASEDKKFVCTL